jgi:excisionase family DNA binding protein
VNVGTVRKEAFVAVRSVAVHQSQESESAEIQDLYRLFLLEKAPALVGPDRKAIPIPESIYNILLQVIGYMKEGKGVSIVPIMQDLTTQAAANLLGVSRPFLIELLNEGKIPFHKTGTHRRICLKDVLAYRDSRDEVRKRVLSDIAKQSLEDGTYDEIYVPDKHE